MYFLLNFLIINLTMIIIRRDIRQHNDNLAIKDSTPEKPKELMYLSILEVCVEADMYIS